MMRSTGSCLARPSQALHDLMRMAALSGARLEALVDLRARDVDLKAHTFTFKPQKKEKAARAVPIHSALVEIVARRLTGKRGADDLFPEYPVPKHLHLSAGAVLRCVEGVHRVSQGCRGG